MPKFILTGDIRHAAKVSVRAANKEEALKKAASGEFSIEEKFSPTEFIFDGDEDDHIEVVD
jgi:hypothetical protein